jgi:hypothetical protein
MRVGPESVDVAPHLAVASPDGSDGLQILGKPDSEPRMLQLAQSFLTLL